MKIRYALIIAGAVILFLLSYLVYIEIDSVSWMGYSKYNDKDFEVYISKTDDAVKLLSCFSMLYEKENKEKISTLQQLVTENYLKTLPKEYYSTKIGSNKLYKFSNSKLYNLFLTRKAGWVEEQEDGRLVNFYPTYGLMEWNVMVYQDKADINKCGEWINTQGKKQFKGIIIRVPKKEKIE